MKIFKLNIKISRTWLIILAIVFIIAGWFIISNALKSPLDSYITEKVSAGKVLQEISETGSVKATDDISLSFKAAGKIARINAAVGNDVKIGDILVELDVNQISAQLQNAIFLIESGIFGMLGGVGGTLLGLIFAKSIEIYFQIHPLFYLKADVSPGLIIFSIAFSFLIGCISGYFPARSAAKLKPVDALRYE
ncbi:MAG: FtsX-like permease family protein [Patescibacteria group bacterium]